MAVEYWERRIGAACDGCDGYVTVSTRWSRVCIENAIYSLHGRWQGPRGVCCLFQPFYFSFMSPHANIQIPSLHARTPVASATLRTPIGPSPHVYPQIQSCHLFQPFTRYFTASGVPFSRLQ